ncbi:MAG: GGDEF domain-containing protein [Pseudoflavonifractor sp.]|nr:GGDEF domain-containing protein [Pseudoflavonifractor sp.]
MLKLIVQDYTLFVCVFTLIFLFWCYRKNRDKEFLYFISADILYFLGSLCFDIISQPMNMPIDSIFYCFFYFSIFLYLEQRTKNLVKNPTLGGSIKLITWAILTIDFLIVFIFSYLIFYYFDRSLLSSQLLLPTFDFGKAINIVYPFLDFVLLGYYVYISKAYILSDEIIYIPLTVSALIWTIGDFLYAFEVVFPVSSYKIGDDLQLLGFILLIIILLLIKSNKVNIDYSTIDLYQEYSKFGIFPILMNGLILAYLAIYFYCLIRFSNTSLLMKSVKDFGIILLVLAILRQNIVNYNIQGKLIILSKDAKTDPLTGLFSRKYAFSLIENVFKSSLYFNISISALMLDIDNFKKFNDTWGHSCGDYVLINISSLIKSSVETSNIVCRYGGEEILIILPGIDQSEGMLIAEKIRQNIEDFDFHNGKMQSGIRVTVSIGGATAGNNTKNELELIDLADAALYKAKVKKNDVFWCSPDETSEKLSKIL